MNNNPMNVTANEVLCEDNRLRPTSYHGAFFRGDFRFIVELQTRRAIMFFEFCEN